MIKKAGSKRRSRKWKYADFALKRRYCANPECHQKLKRDESGPLCDDCYVQLKENLMKRSGGGKNGE